LIENVDTKEIKNVEMKMTLDDRALTVSTYMRNISVIEYKRTEKFNKDMQSYEVTMKPQRNKSVSGIKDPIDCFDYSNDNKFFIVGCENSKIKIFQNFGNFEDSKMFSEFTAKDISSLNGDKVSLYVTGFFNGKISGFVAISNDSDLFIYDTDGKLHKVIQNAHDSKILLLKLVQNTSGTGASPLLLTASRDARFHVWNIVA
jgi:WD40 repeat protein